MPRTTYVRPLFLNLSWDRTGEPPIPEILKVVIDNSVDNVSYAFFSVEYENSTTEWLTSSTGGVYIYLNNDYGELQLLLQNTNALPAGTYTAIVNVQLHNDVGLVEDFPVEVTLTLTGNASIQIEKPFYSLTFNRATNTLSGDSLVNILNNSGGTALKFWQNNNIFAAAENFTTNFSLTEDAANPFLTNAELPQEGLVQIPSKILTQSGDFVAGFTVELYVSDGGINVIPNNISFEIFKGSAEKSETVRILNPSGLDFTITDIPDWLSVSASSGNSNANIVVTTNTATKNAGNYNAILKINYNNTFKEVAVNLTLKQFIVMGTPEFCLDFPPVEIWRKTETANSVKITLTAVYEVMGVTQQIQKIYALPYFQGKAYFEIGEKLHRLFPRIKREFFSLAETVLMQKISASIKVEELNAEQTVLFSQTIQNLRFLPGRKPKAFPLLTNFQHRTKNGVSKVFASVVENDLVKLYPSTNLVTLYNFPKSANKIDLQWENQNLVPEWFTLSGDYKVSPEFNHVYARNIFNAQNEKFDTSKIKTLTVNTGLVLAQERELITEMIESLISFAKIGDKVYRCFNITKKNIEIDSSEELVSRELEFLIVEQ